MTMTMTKKYRGITFKFLETTQGVVVYQEGSWVQMRHDMTAAVTWAKRRAKLIAPWWRIV